MTAQRDKHYASPSLLMSTFLIRSATSQSSSYPIVLTRLGGPLSRPSSHLKFGNTGNRTRSHTPWPLDQWGGHALVLSVVIVVIPYLNIPQIRLQVSATCRKTKSIYGLHVIITLLLSTTEVSLKICRYPNIGRNDFMDGGSNQCRTP